tara:strand:+ start:200 stop:403 length:204 start_codon:yes stop_codon:yes gene_type:complete
MLFVWKQKVYSRSPLEHLLAHHFLVQVAVWGNGVAEVLKTNSIRPDPLAILGFGKQLHLPGPFQRLR